MQIDKEEVLRYLGYTGQQMDDAMQKMVDETIALCGRMIRPRFIYQQFVLEREVQGIALQGTDLLLEGDSIRAHLRGCTQAVLLAATLGMEIDNRVRVMQRTDMAQAVILDACAAAAIETVCDEACSELTADAAKKGLTTTSRFSPGYGDLPLHLQKGLIGTLNAPKRIGLTVSESDILLPRKSVTAIIGLAESGAEIQKRRSCGDCPVRETCSYRKAGGHCGN